MEDVRWSVALMTLPWSRVPSNTDTATAVIQAGRLQRDQRIRD